MAYINVSEKIPVANTKFVKDYVSSVDFREIMAGIELAVRPRVNDDGTESFSSDKCVSLFSGSR